MKSNLIRGFGRSVVLAVVLVLILSGCSKGKLKPGEVKDSTESIAVTVPAGWTKSPKEVMGSKLILLGTANNGFTTNINLYIENVGSVSLDDYIKINNQNAGKLVSGYSTISERPTTLAGVSAHEHIYSGIVGNQNTKLQFKQVYAIKNGNAYILTYTALQQDFNTAAGSFDSVVNSLRWLK